jgi:hypothetical protein
MPMNRPSSVLALSHFSVGSQLLLSQCADVTGARASVQVAGMGEPVHIELVGETCVGTLVGACRRIGSTRHRQSLGGPAWTSGSTESGACIGTPSGLSSDSQRPGYHGADIGSRGPQHPGHRAGRAAHGTGT